MRFELLQPESLEEAISFLGSHPEETRVIAGGQSLLLMLHSGLVRPRFLLALGSLDALAGIGTTPTRGLRIGALATHRQILGSELVREKAALLQRAAWHIGSTPVRNFGTIGGNLCHNEMGSDPPAAPLVLEAEAECAGPRGKRKISMTELLTGYFETSLDPDEILVGVQIPPLPDRSQAIYLKHTMRAGDLAVVGVAALLRLDKGACREIRLALVGVGPVPFRAVEAEKLLSGKLLTEDAIEEAAAAALAMSDPMSDAHASADYRRKMVRVFVRRALDQLSKNGNGEKR